MSITASQQTTAFASASARALWLLKVVPTAQTTATTAVKTVSQDTRSNTDQLIRLGERNAYDQAALDLGLSYPAQAKLSAALALRGDVIAATPLRDIASFDPHDSAQLAALGADAAIQIPPLVLDDAAFTETVVPLILKQFAAVDGFAEALAAGQVKVQRTSEVPEFNFGHNNFALFSRGSMIGGAGWGRAFNQPLFDQVAATGLQQGFGSMLEQDYYVTWAPLTPMNTA